jgi:hypothetical protein
MRRKESQYNPLPRILEIISDGVEVNSKTISDIAYEFNKGGVVCANAQEVLTCLNILYNMNLIEADSDNIRVIKHGKENI